MVDGAFAPNPLFTFRLDLASPIPLLFKNLQSLITSILALSLRLVPFPATCFFTLHSAFSHPLSRFIH